MTVRLLCCLLLACPAIAGAQDRADPRRAAPSREDRRPAPTAERRPERESRAEPARKEPAPRPREATRPSADPVLRRPSGR